MYVCKSLTLCVFATPLGRFCVAVLPVAARGSNIVCTIYTHEHTNTFCQLHIIENDVMTMRPPPPDVPSKKRENSRKIRDDADAVVAAARTHPNTNSQTFAHTFTSGSSSRRTLASSSTVHIPPASKNATLIPNPTKICAPFHALTPNSPKASSIPTCQQTTVYIQNPKYCIFRNEPGLTRNLCTSEKHHHHERV